MGINFYHVVQTKKEKSEENNKEVWSSNLVYTNTLNEFFYTRNFHNSNIAKLVDYKLEKFPDGYVFCPLYENKNKDKDKELKYYDYCQYFNLENLHNKIHLKWAEREAEGYNYEDYMPFRMFLHRLMLDKEHYNIDIRIAVATNFH